jgi:hypothetical protein
VQHFSSAPRRTFQPPFTSKPHRKIKIVPPDQWTVFIQNVVSVFFVLSAVVICAADHFQPHGVGDQAHG